MNRIQWITIILLSLMHTHVFAAPEFLSLDFDLKDLPNSDCNTKSSTDEQLDSIANTLNDPTFWKELIASEVSMDKDRVKNTVFIIPVDKKQMEELNVLGLTAKQSLQLSGDQEQDAVCGEGHDQGTMNNRFCHSYIAQSFSAWLQRRGVSKTLASFAGGIFWVPKEFLVDMNPSAHDLPFTIADNLGTKSTTFQVTVYGDSFYKKYFGKDFTLFKESTPFIAITRKF